MIRRLFVVICLLFIVCSAAGGELTDDNSAQNEEIGASLRIHVAPESSSTIIVGSQEQFNAFEDCNFETVTNMATWDSSNTTVATVSNTGLVSALVLGTTNITATFSNIISAPKLLTVAAPGLATIAITSNSLTIPNGVKQSLTAIGYDAAGATVPVPVFTWSIGAVDDTGIAAISDTGTVVGKKVGTVTVIATSGQISGKIVLEIINNDIVLSNKTIAIIIVGAVIFTGILASTALVCSKCKQYKKQIIPNKEQVFDVSVVHNSVIFKRESQGIDNPA